MSLVFRHFSCFRLGGVALKRERFIVRSAFCFFLNILTASPFGLWIPHKDLEVCWFKEAMEVFGKSMVAVPTNVIYLSSILGQDGPNPCHKCDWKCGNEHICGNMYRCRLTGLTHICDKNCNQRILYDNHSSLCRVSRQVFPLTLDEEQAVRGVCRKTDAESSPSDCCAFKRKRDAQFHPSSFERSFSAVGPICSPVGDGMDMS